jgi:hypothetical protein
MKHLLKFNESKRGIVIDISVEPILRQLKNHQDPAIRNVAKSLLMFFDFDVVQIGEEIKITRLLRYRGDQRPDLLAPEFDVETISKFEKAFKELNGSSVIKVG